MSKKILEAGDVRLVIIDPLAAYLGGTDDHKNGDLRGLLAPLSEMAERLHVAVVLVTHLNKSVGIKSIYRLSGSVAFVAIARMALLILQDPELPKRRLMLQIKSNILDDRAGLAFSLIDRAISWESEPVNLTANQVLAAEEQRTPTRKKPRDNAVEFLAKILSDGPVPSTELFAQTRRSGFSDNTVRRAQAELGIKPKQMQSSEGQKWCWSLPADDHSNPIEELEHLSTWEEQSTYDGGTET